MRGSCGAPGQQHAEVFQSNLLCWANGPIRARLNGRTGNASEMRFSMPEWIGM